jgi:hypothetical protein
MTRTLIMPAAMKVIVAKIERTEKRLIPHTPWPLVQPLPKRVPTPTMNPAASKVGNDRGDAPMLSGAQSAAAAPAASKPRKNSARHQTSPLVRWRRPPTIPLMPAIRPLAINRIEAARPIKPPPMSAEMGVKSCMSLFFA